MLGQGSLKIINPLYQRRVEPLGEIILLFRSFQRLLQRRRLQRLLRRARSLHQRVEPLAEIGDAGLRLLVLLSGHFQRLGEAVAETERKKLAEDDAAWRVSFQPHGIILTEHSRPTHITFAAITGADQQLRVDFEPGSSRITYVKQAIKAARQRSPIRFYGRAVGVIVNFAPDAAVRFDLDGNAVEVLTSAYRPGELTLAIRGRPVSKDALDAIFFGAD